MPQQYCSQAPGAKPGARRKCLTHNQALALTPRYEIQQCGHCGTWHFHSTLPTKPPVQKYWTTERLLDETPRPSENTRKHGRQTFAALKKLFN